VDEVNALNVFPVPDGDTGSNMLATVRAALAEAERVPVNDRSLFRVADALSLGALMGARGNSGLILSQVLGGMAEAARDKYRADGADLRHALRRGAERAYAAVSHPVEGTILTVAREAAEAANGIADAHVETVLVTAVDGAQQSVARTPSLLPILREAGVVDSGGHGLYLLMRGLLLDLVDDEPTDALGLALAAPNLEALVQMPGHDENGYGYETMFVVRADSRPLDVNAMRAHLSSIGESVMVAGDARLANVHVHNEHPDQVIAYGLTLGTLSKISVENLDLQAAGRAQGEDRAGASRASGSAAPATPVPTDGLAVVAVAPGEGFARTFAAAGAAAIVRGGATANPSTEDFLRAINGVDAANVIVLANHKNVVLVARQAAALANGRSVEVIATRNPAEGIAALLRLDPRRDLAANAGQMREAAAAVPTLAVTHAVRDARISGRDVREGETLVLDPDEGVIASGNDRIAVTMEGIATLGEGFELLTIYTGLGVDPAEAQRLRDSITQRLRDVEVELVDGGQPHYAYVIAAE
jgi:uncharacterized protein